MGLRSASPPRLISLAISPYNEFARWSLDRCGIVYEERRQALVLHAIVSRLVGGKGTTPALVTEDGTLGESAEIAEWADVRAAPERKIYPVDRGERERARGLVKRFLTGLRPARRIPWDHIIDDPELAARYWDQGIPGWQARTQGWALRAARPISRRELGLTGSGAAEAPALVEEVFDEVAGTLADGRPHLLGERFGVADICFAAMAAPAVHPIEGFPVRYIELEELPDRVIGVIERFRVHPAGEYALRMYRERRPRDRAGS